MALGGTNPEVEIPADKAPALILAEPMLLRPDFARGPGFWTESRECNSSSCGWQNQERKNRQHKNGSPKSSRWTTKGWTGGFTAETLSSRKCVAFEAVVSQDEPTPTIAKPWGRWSRRPCGEANVYFIAWQDKAQMVNAGCPVSPAPAKFHYGHTSAALLSNDRGKRRIGDARRVVNGKGGHGIQGAG